MELTSTRYFSLNPATFLVTGALRGALYELESGDVFSVDPVAVRVLQACEAGRPLDEIARDVTEADHAEIVGFFQRVADAGMGTFSELPRNLPKLDINRRYETLDFIWFELREDCNLHCRHCYCMSQPGGDPGDRLTLDDWKRLLREAAELGCRSVQFIGGEPFLFGPGLFELAGRARELGYSSVAVFSNLTFLKDEWIDRLLDLRMEVACSLYARDPAVHDEITGHPGSHQRTLKFARKLMDRGIQPRFCVTVMKQNQDCLDDTLAFVKELGMDNPGFDLVRPSGRGNDEELLPDKYSKKRAYQKRAEFMLTRRDTFIRRYNGNGCWQGKLAISSTGYAHPCIMQREGDSGNVRQQSLRSIVSGDIRKYWDLSYDKIEVCRDCEYRYACHDCRPVTCGSTGDLTAKSLHCSYDPYRGEWLDME